MSTKILVHLLALDNEGISGGKNLTGKLQCSAGNQ